MPSTSAAIPPAASAKPPISIQFSPRLADTGGARFWLINPAADYGKLSLIATNRIDTRLIKEHYDDLLRVAGSLLQRETTGSELMRALRSHTRHLATLGLGPASAARIEIPAAAPQALDARAQLRYLRAVQACSSPRDQALALVPFYAGARISEIVALDIDDVARSARKGVLRILGKGERVRHVPIHPQLNAAIAGWLAERADWPGANDSPALFLNQRGQRLSVRGAHDIITGIAAAAGLDDDTTVHTLRHTFATTLVRGGTDLVIVAELLGHARLETTRGYTRSSAEDRTRALDLLLVDE